MFMKNSLLDLRTELKNCANLGIQELSWRFLPHEVVKAYGIKALQIRRVARF